MKIFAWPVLPLIALFFLSAVSLPVLALEEDDEAIAAREKAAKEKALADKKAKNPGNAKDEAAADPGKKDANNIFGGDKKSEKENPFNGKTDPKKAAVTPPAVAKQDALPAAPNAADGLCPQCKGVGLLPNLPYKPYMKFEGQPPPNPDFVAAWKYCDKCMPGKDAAAVSDDMKERQQRAIDKHKGFEENTGKTLAQFETPFITGRSMMPAGVNKNMASAMEKCAGILQANSKSMVLLPTRPDTDDIIFMADEKTYITYIDNTWQGNDGEGKALAKKTSGTEGQHVSGLKMTMPGPPFEDRAVFTFSGMLMRNATNAKAKPWLLEGFSAYCENATLGNNLIYRIAYEMNTVKFGKNWNDDIKQYAKTNKLKTWPEIFGLDLVHMKPMEYEMCYSIISYLIKGDPVKFDKMVLNVADGDDSDVAIEKAYGRKIKDLHADWLKWILTQK